MRIVQSARKHGVADEDMLHAVRQSITDWRLIDDFVIRVGAGRDGTLLAVGILDTDDEPLIIHAMKCRPQYLPNA